MSRQHRAMIEKPGIQGSFRPCISGARSGLVSAATRASIVLKKRSFIRLSKTPTASDHALSSPLSSLFLRFSQSLFKNPKHRSASIRQVSIIHRFCASSCSEHLKAALPACGGSAFANRSRDSAFTCVRNGVSATSVSCVSVRCGHGREPRQPFGTIEPPPRRGIGSTSGGLPYRSTGAGADRISRRPCQQEPSRRLGKVRV
jgi:hypothetical protein